MPIQRDKWALGLLTSVIFAAALACLVWAVVHVGQPAPLHPLYPLMGVALMALGAVLPAPLPSRMPVRITLTPTACLVCASALPVPWLILCTAVGVTLARLVTRYPRSSGLHKAVHNTSMDVVTSAVAGLVMFAFGLRPVLTEPDLDGPGLLRQLVAFLLAAVTVLVLEELTTAAAVTLETRRPFSVVARYLWRIRLIVAVGEIVTAGIVAVIAVIDRRALIALPVVMLILYFTVTHRLRIREERRAWEHLAALSDALSARDLDVVLRTAAAGAVDLFSARAADIEIDGGRRLVRAVGAVGDTRVVYDGPADGVGDAAGSRSVVRHEIGGDAAGLQGAMRLHLAGRSDVLSVREQATLRAFAATLSTSVDNARAYDLLAQEARRHQLAATQDPETGLRNRPALLSHIVETNDDTVCHVVAIRLENYHLVADSIGRDRALLLINELAARLCYAARDRASVVGRVGDAEFTLVLRGVPKEAAYQRACWAVAALRRPVTVNGQALGVRASAGMTSGSADDVANLLAAAERVMWQAIRGGHDRLVSYQPAPVHSSSLVDELVEARMSISVEPIVDLTTGQIIMVQSVPRVLYSRHDVLVADEHVYQLVADQGGLEALAHKIIFRSLTAAATWREVLPRAGLIVPVPGRAITPDFVAALQDLLLTHGVTGSSLVLGIAEPTGLPSRGTTDVLQRHGVRLLLDNYGSIQGSIESLNAANWSFLRLHPAYALDAGWRPARSVIRAAIDLAIDLELSVIAPGITVEDERRELAALGCPLGSGPLFGGEMFPSQVRGHATLWQPDVLPIRAPIPRLHRAGTTAGPPR
ncbi:EAL domain-containing protein [Micromonospora antibiotica]|uniref:EAL domain-containing protein n=1 Tax=Micromonospora antibiotica TaxID=2807623 RepID=A0ABS3VFT2_9ACTN|nr:EAL domain-containing protein [Micromonospora antibiotica]MBO4164422.1 EAL domain-containing protein [Micromonospora antibiotica]